MTSKTSAFPSQLDHSLDFSRRCSLAIPFSIPFGISAFGSASCAAGGMPEYGECPSGTLAAGCSENEKENGCPLGRRLYGMVPTVVGYPLGHPTPPQPCVNREGRTALHWAVSHGHLPSVHALIDAGASLDIQNIYRWALGRSARPIAAVGVGQCRRCLVARRSTPLHLAADYGHAAATAALLGAGADASIENCGGYDAPRRTARPTATAAAAVPAGGQQSNTHDGMESASRTRRRCSRRVAALLAIASPTPAAGCAHFVHS